jgi:hypothetical protein
MKRFCFGAAAMLVVLASASCDEELSSITGPTPNLTPTLSSIQREIFNVTDSSGRLMCIGCHTDQGRAPSSNLVLLEGRSHQQLVGRASTGKPGATLVIPGDPDNSYIIKKLEGAADINGQRMPRGNGPFLIEGQITVIRKWIQDGAQNN